MSDKGKKNDNQKEIEEAIRKYPGWTSEDDDGIDYKNRTPIIVEKRPISAELREKHKKSAELLGKLVVEALREAAKGNSFKS